MPRIYTRKFSWEEAIRLRSEGMTFSAIAERLGVSSSAIYFACNPEAYARAKEAVSRWQSTGVCPRCGAQASRNASGKQHVCVDCANDLRATSVRETELYCSSCEQWKPDDDFPFNRAGRTRRRGRHHSCRECLTRQRQAYRLRHKVPCVGCGKPALPPNEKGTSVSFPRCWDCYNRDRRAGIQGEL